MFLECIATTLEDAKLIEQAGANRIELVTSLTEGGLTPSYGLIEAVVNQVSIPVNVMVRPHAQSFCYQDHDLQIMKRDIQMIRSIGANGVVLGVLTESGKLYRAALEDLLRECGQLEVTFHRAIDAVDDPVQLVKELKNYPQINTILTSGGTGSWPMRLDTIQEMIKNSGHISILVGSGLDLENIRPIDALLQTDQFHFGTAIRKQRDPLQAIDLQVLKQLIEIVN